MACQNDYSEYDNWVDELEEKPIIVGVSDPYLSETRPTSPSQDIVSSGHSNLDTNFAFETKLFDNELKNPIFHELVYAENAFDQEVTRAYESHSPLGEIKPLDCLVDQTYSVERPFSNFESQIQFEEHRPNSPIVIHPCRDTENFVFSMTAPPPNLDNQRIVLECDYYNSTTQTSRKNLMKRLREYKKGEITDARMIQYVFDYASRLAGKVCLYTDGLPMITRKTWVDFTGYGPVYGNMGYQEG